MALEMKPECQGCAAPLGWQDEAQFELKQPSSLRRKRLEALAGADRCFVMASGGRFARTHWASTAWLRVG